MEGISREEKCAVFRAGFQQRTEIQCKNTVRNAAEETLEIWAGRDKTKMISLSMSFHHYFIFLHY
jgi:hypothetical protein